MNKFVVEFIGTFFLVLTICLAPAELGPLAIGAVLVALVYAGGHVSDAHYNPAVTIGMMIRGRCPREDVVPYIVSQTIAAALAAGLFLFFHEGNAKPALFPEAKLLAAEYVFTFALMWVILNVATASATRNNQFYGLAIGAVVAAGAFALGPVSGAAFNPAVAFGLCLSGHLDWSQIWAFLLATIAGAASAAYVFLAFVEDGDGS